MKKHARDKDVNETEQNRKKKKQMMMMMMKRNSEEEEEEDADEEGKEQTKENGTKKKKLEVSVFSFDGKRVVEGLHRASKKPLNCVKIDVRKEQKRFMSADVDRIVREQISGEDSSIDDKKKNRKENNRKNGNDDDDDEDGHDRATAFTTTKMNGNKNNNNKNEESKFSMKYMRREVRDFGIGGLNKWDRKDLENRKLREMGMKVKTGIRIPATIGVGLWKKNEQRKEDKRLELHLLGHKLEKKAKKKTATNAAETGGSGTRDEDRGLAWGSSWFKNGILKLKKSDMKKQRGAMNVDTKVRLSGNSRDSKGASSGGGKKSKKGAKGSKKRGAGKKSSR
jgi:hypothetical protein